MAKKTTKTAEKAPSKKAASPKEPIDLLEKASTQAIATLQALGIEQQLQADLEWCLGSYHHDKNPSGLYDMTERALIALQEAKSRKAKGVTVKLLSDLEKALQSR